MCHRITNTDRNLLGCVGRSECLGMCKQSAAQHGRKSLFLLSCGVNCPVLCGNSELKVFETSIRADVATSVKLQFQDSFVTQQPPRPTLCCVESYDRLGSVPCCLYPGITSHADTFFVPLYSVILLRATSLQRTYCATPVLPVRLYDMPEWNSSVSIEKYGIFVRSPNIH
jgi:hypothetical protein